MSDPALVEYIRKKLNEGVSEFELKKFLKAEGWKDFEISEATNMVRSRVQENTPENTFDRPEEKEEPVIHRSQKAVFGTALSLIAGLIVINNFLPVLVDSATIQSIILPFLESIGISGVIITILNIVFGVLIVIGAFMIFKGNGGRGGIIVLAISVVYFFINGFALGVILGIVGGLLGISKK